MCAKTVKTALAGLCAVVAVAVGLPLMFTSETHIDVKIETVPQVASFYDMTVNQILAIPQVAAMVQMGLKPYFMGFGLVLLMIAIAFVLVDGNEHITTLTGRETDETF